MRLSPTLLASALLAFGATGVAHAQATVKNDGVMRSAVGLGASFTSGNSSSRTLSLTADAVRLTDQDKVSLYGNAQYARAGGTTTVDSVRAGGRYDWNLNPDWFAFGGLDFTRDVPANLALRSSLSTGLGWHVVKSPTTTFDVFGGVGFNHEKYDSAAAAGKSSYSYASLLIGEESTHKLSDTTSFKQRLVVRPNLKDRGEYLANFDAGLAVAMSKTMNLNVGLSTVYNSAPTAGRSSTDTLLTTGVSIKFE